MASRIENDVKRNTANWSKDGGDRAPDNLPVRPAAWQIGLGLVPLLPRLPSIFALDAIARQTMPSMTSLAVRRAMGLHSA
jgi:hypothetical protein